MKALLSFTFFSIVILNFCPLMAQSSGSDSASQCYADQLAAESRDQFIAQGNNILVEQLTFQDNDED